jgi:hypothetical protein
MAVCEAYVYHGDNSGDEMEVKSLRPSKAIGRSPARARIASFWPDCTFSGGTDKTTEEVRMAKKPSGRGSVSLGKSAAAIKDRLKASKIIDWHQLGTPNPEVIIGTVQSSLGNFKTNVGALTKLKELRDLNILIHGIPRPDIAQIKFTLKG